MKKLYGLELEYAENLLLSQNSECKICKTKISFERGVHRNSVACIDHCHNSNKVRGVLCHKCNAALGLFRESPEIVQNAYNYLF